MPRRKPVLKPSERAVDAVFDILARSALGTHETTVAKASGLPLAEVEVAVAAMIADRTLVRVATGVLFFSAEHAKRLDADFKSRCCAEPSIRGGRCCNCGEWHDDLCVVTVGA